MNTSADEKLDLSKINPQGGSSDLSNLEQELFKILEDIVQPGDKITPQTAAESINQHLRNFPRRSEEKEKDVKAVEDFLHTFWTLFIAIVESTPYNHPGQDRLFSTLTSLIEKSEGSYEIWGVSYPHAYLYEVCEVFYRCSYYSLV